MAVLSLLVLVGITSLFVTPTTTAFATTLATSRVASRQEVFYGTISASGAPDAKVLVVAYHYRGKLKVHDLSVATSPSGSYRLSLPAGNRPEYVEFFKGRTMTSVRVILRPGTAYKISGRLVVKRFLFYLPVFSY